MKTVYQKYSRRSGHQQLMNTTYLLLGLWDSRPASLANMMLLDVVGAGYLSLEDFLFKASYGDRFEGGEAPMSIRSMKVGCR
jgi:hypothetical protein